MEFAEQWNRARWASRRGLLELDLLLSPFVETEFERLDEVHRELYRELLQFDDQDLMEWIMGRGAPEDDRYLPILDAIRHVHRIGL